MANLTRRFGLLRFVLLALALSGCAAAVDEDAASDEAASSFSQALKSGAASKADAVLDADAAGCDAASAKAGAQTQDDQYQEFMSVVGGSNSSVDLAPAGNSCTAACKCCGWGNRFCCSHCKWCSWPVVSTGVLAK